MYNNILKTSWIDTPLGKMFVVSDEQALYVLKFIEQQKAECEVNKIRIKTKMNIIVGINDPIISIVAEPKSYFDGSLKEFKTPFYLLGSQFQKLVWKELIHTPYGQTRSYAEQAMALGKRSACRAVANANVANQLTIVIPCHRIINSSGGFGGYSAGIIRKRWLINHEKANNIKTA